MDPALEACARIATALVLRLELELVDPREHRAVVSRAVDHLHSAMAELVAAHLRGLGCSVAIDEPYQHYQYAGRGDVLAWDLDARARARGSAGPCRGSVSAAFLIART